MKEIASFMYWVQVVLLFGGLTAVAIIAIGKCL